MAKGPQRPARLNVSPPKTALPDPEAIARQSQGQRRDMQAVLVVPSVDKLLREAQAIIGRDISNLLRVTHDNAPLSHDDALKLYRHVRALKTVADEDREGKRAAKVDALSDDELMDELLLHLKTDPELREQVLRQLVGVEDEDNG